MTSQQFLAQLKQQEPSPVYLFIGPEPYQRDFCRKALIQKLLPSAEERENGLTRHDLQEISLDAVVEDAQSLSLFATQRVIVVSSAEAALPRGRAAEDTSEEGAAGGKGSAAAIEAYLQNPAPGVVMVFEASRYGFTGDDKKKLERVQKFYAAIRAQVEFPPMPGHQARGFARNLANRAGLAMGDSELDQLVEALGGEAARIAAEIEKLRIYAGDSKEIHAADIAHLVPEARESTIFALVAALGRNDREAALGILDTLIKQSEYLPLALSFLAGQFRMALASKEAGLRTPQQIQAHFSKQGIPMWGSKADQVFETVSSFSKAKLALALELIFAADRALRDTRPDDRVVMERFVLRLTG